MEATSILTEILRLGPSGAAMAAMAIYFLRREKKQDDEIARVRAVAEARERELTTLLQQRETAHAAALLAQADRLQAIIADKDDATERLQSQRVADVQTNAAQTLQAVRESVVALTSAESALDRNTDTVHELKVSIDRVADVVQRGKTGR